MSTNTVAGAVAKRDDAPPKAKALVAQYRNDFAEVLPSHIKATTWVRLAQGALKKGRIAKDDPYGRTELEVAACNNPGAFLAALLEAARLGLEPGTDFYYLTPRRNKKNQGKLEILGIVGYQGHIELMYNAGAIASVVAEVVYERDIFRFRPGADDIPHHEIDWDAEDRGALRLVYAFARMKDGATSKVVVLNKTAIAKIRAVSPAAGYEDSIWDKWEEAMWLKSAVRQLQKWVPTSAELRNRDRTATEAPALGMPELSPQGSTTAAGELAPVNITDTWTEEGDGVVDGEVVTEPEVAPRITETQSKQLHAILTKGEINRETKLAILSHITKREITTSGDLTEAEAVDVIEQLRELELLKIPLIEAVIELIDRPGDAS